MKLWLLLQNENKQWNAYTGAVVAAETEEKARLTHPNCCSTWDGEWHTVGLFGRHVTDPTEWIDPKDVIVEMIGETNQGAGVILASAIKDE